MLFRSSKRYDTPESFFYIDPPYPGSNQGHYTGYSIEDLHELLELLKNIQGKFLLSNYPQDIIDVYCELNDGKQDHLKWYYVLLKRTLNGRKLRC